MYLRLDCGRFRLKLPAVPVGILNKLVNLDSWRLADSTCQPILSLRTAIFTKLAASSLSNIFSLCMTLHHDLFRTVYITSRYGFEQMHIVKTQLGASLQAWRLVQGPN